MRHLAASLLAFVLIAVTACERAEPLEPAPASSSTVDEFDGSGLAAEWLRFGEETAAIEVRDGALHIVPNRNVVWWMADTGPMVYREVTGNFRLTTVVRNRKASDTAAPVDSGYQFGGVMMRVPNPDDAPENYIFNVVGWRGEYMSAETKNTYDDVSEVMGPPWDTGDADAELRICRVDGRFELYNRPIGGDTWTHAVSYRRPEFPATMEAGLIAYSYTDSWDLDAAFDRVEIVPVATLDDCTLD